MMFALMMRQHLEDKETTDDDEDDDDDDDEDYDEGFNIDEVSAQIVARREQRRPPRVVRLMLRPTNAR